MTLQEIAAFGISAVAVIGAVTTLVIQTQRLILIAEEYMATIRKQSATVEHISAKVDAHEEQVNPAPPSAS